MCADILSTLSQRQVEVLRAHAEREEVFVAQKPIELMQLIKLTLVDNVDNLPEEERQDILSVRETNMRMKECRSSVSYMRI
jgi:hypothetical protein